MNHPLVREIKLQCKTPGSRFRSNSPGLDLTMLKTLEGWGEVSHIRFSGNDVFFTVEKKFFDRMTKAEMRRVSLTLPATIGSP